MDMVGFERLISDDETTIKNLIFNHHKYTRSLRAKGISDNFNKEKKRFIKVMPIEYKRILEGTKVERKLGLLEASDG